MMYGIGILNNKVPKQQLTTKNLEFSRKFYQLQQILRHIASYITNLADEEKKIGIFRGREIKT